MIHPSTPGAGDREGGDEPSASLRGAARRKPQVLDLFSGIGGFALAFEAAGFETIAFSEIEPYPCKVLAQHWPEVPNLGDVRGIDGRDFAGVDVVCGGFPCQDISTAGKGAGIHGERSSLWFEMLRIIRGSRPAFCLLENVPALRSCGADVVLGGLEEAGYACRPFVVGAGNAGAPHQRARAWVVAYAHGLGTHREDVPAGSREDWKGASQPIRMGEGVDAYANAKRCFGSGERVVEQPRGAAPFGIGQVTESGGNWWSTEPALDRVVHGIPNRAHRIKALGNSIVPAVAYPFAVWIYNALMAPQAPRSAERAEGPLPATPEVTP